MITIPVSHLPGILICLWGLSTGYNNLADPLVKLIRRKGFNFEDAMVSTTVGLIEIAIWLVALAIVWPK